MKSIFIYEVFPLTHRHKPDPHSLAIAATPEAAYQLGKAGVCFSYLDPENHYEELLKGEDRYFDAQMSWMRRLDAMLQSQIDVCGKYQIRLLESNYIRVKYVLDTCFIYSKIISNFFSMRSDICNVTVVRPAASPISRQPGIFSFDHNHRNDFYNILKYYCRTNKVRYAEICVDSEVPANSPKKVAKRRPPRLKYFIKSVYYFFKFKKFVPRKSAASQPVGFFMHLGGLDTDEYLRQSWPFFKKVYSYEKNQVFDEGIFRNLVYSFCDITEPEASNEIFKQCSKVTEELEQKIALDEMFDNETCDAVSQTITSYLNDFLKIETPQILAKSILYKKTFKDLQVTQLYCRGNSDIDSIALIIAAKHMTGVKVFCIQHASSGFSGEALSIYDTVTYDAVLARDPVTYYYLDSLFKSNHQAQVIKSYHYLHAQKRKQRPLEKKCVSSNKQLTVLYVQKKFPRHMLFLNEGMYWLMWYYQYQKKLIDFMGRNSHLNWVYKHAAGQAWAEESILKYIQDKQYPNIKIGTHSFLDSLLGVDRVIVDFASGALFESVTLGLPTLCLVPRYFRISPYAEETFGDIIQRGSSIDDFLEKIRIFISIEPSKILINSKLIQLLE